MLAKLNLKKRNNLISKSAFLFLLNTLFFAFIFHSIRDILQLFGIEFWFTNIFHQLGIKITDIALGFFNLSYNKWIDVLFLILEFLTIGYILKRKRILKLKLIGNF